MTPAAVRLVRTAAVVVLVLLLCGGTARAAGTGGVEVTPFPGVVDGKQQTAFHVDVPTRGDTSVRYVLRNTTSEPRSAKLYAASATPDGKGGYAIGDPGSSPYVDLPARTVSLKGKESRLERFRAHGEVEGTRYAAVVVEVTNGAITQRAATLVYLERGRTVPLPLLLVLLAVGLLVVVGGAVLLSRRSTRRRQDAAPDGAAG